MRDGHEKTAKSSQENSPHRNIHEYSETTRITQAQTGTRRIRPDKQEQEEHSILVRTGSSRQERHEHLGTGRNKRNTPDRQD